MTVLSGLSVLTVVTFSLFALLLGGFGVVMNLGQAIFYLIRNKGQFADPILYMFIEAALLIVMMVIAALACLFALARSGVEFALMIMATSKLAKAKSKKETTFPMVISFIFGGLYLLAGAYVRAVIYALPGIFLAVSKDEVKPAEVEAK